MLDISEDERRIVGDILRLIVPHCTVLAYGSRVRGESHQGSDLDLVVKDKEKVPFERMNVLKEAFDESNLTFSVDVLDWNILPEQFRKSIEENYEVVQGNHSAVVS